MKNQISFSLKMAIMLVFGAISGAQAGQTIVAGGGAVRQEYDSNIYRTNTDRISEWTTAFLPTISISEGAQHYSLFLQYTPSVIYSHLTDEEHWDHLLSAKVEKDWAEGVSSYVRDTFVQSEDPYRDEEAGIELSDSRGRNRYWTNNAAVGLGYDYAKESFVKLSYVNLVLDNENSTYDDYVKHTPGVSIAQRFSEHWQAQVDYFFTKGNFEQEDDLENHAGDLYIYYRPSSKSKIFAHGGYTTNKYDGLKDDYDLSRISLGFDHQVSSTFDFRIEGGESFLIRDELNDQEAFYFLMAINKKIQHGAMSLSGEGGIDEQQFNGTTDQGLSRYWQLQADFNYNLTQDLLSSVKCLFREDNYWERNPEEKEEKLQAEAFLSYTFGRWYTATIGYTYSRQEADVLARCYDDNRVYLQLGFNKDFFRW